MDEATRAVLEQGALLGIPIGLEAWQPDGRALDADAHVVRLAALAAGSADVVTLATDGHQLTEMIDVAGPVRAWTGEE